jgi:hypothetical protein
MKKIIFIIYILTNYTLSAQQLYFVRGVVNTNYDFIEGQPPIQLIAYMPLQDTILQICKDYTETLYARYNTFQNAEHYPAFNVFCFKTLNNKTCMLNTIYPDTIVEIVTHCPKGYKVSPLLSMNIINGYWAYACTSNNYQSLDEDYTLFKGIDLSLNNRFDLHSSAFKDLYLTGSDAQNIILKSNDKNIYLPIVADTSKRPIFSVELPQKYWVNKKTKKSLLVNDDLQTLLALERSIPQKEEDYGRFRGALYNKQKNTWIDLELKGNAPSIMAYGHWLTGAIQDRSDRSVKYFLWDKISPGKVARDSVHIEDSFDEWTKNGFYRPGILYLFNTDTEKYIEWHTNQGDSEILLVQDEVVYYRVFDVIYKAPIINGEQLDKSELLVKDNQVVPYIHWAFIRN